MQPTKDSFLNHLARRLEELDSTRTVTIEGVRRPAVMASENERPELKDAFEECYCIDWAEGASGCGLRGVQSLGCSISYWTVGTAAMSGVDRGRRLTAMDELLKNVLADRQTAKCDLMVVPTGDLGSHVFWSIPKFAAVEQDGAKLRRTAKVDVYYFAEEQR